MHERVGHARDASRLYRLLGECGRVLPCNIDLGLCVAMWGRGRGLRVVVDLGGVLSRSAVRFVASVAAVECPFMFIFGGHC